jgi:hypothetical protein
MAFKREPIPNTSRSARNLEHGDRDHSSTTADEDIYILLQYTHNDTVAGNVC